MRELKLVADHLKEEAYTIKRAEFEARLEIASELKIMPHEVVLPEY